MMEGLLVIMITSLILCIETAVIGIDDIDFCASGVPFIIYSFDNSYQFFSWIFSLFY